MESPESTGKVVFLVSVVCAPVICRKAQVNCCLACQTKSFMIMLPLI